MNGVDGIDRPLMVSSAEEERWRKKGILKKIIHQREEKGHGPTDLAIQSAQAEMSQFTSGKGHLLSVKA